MYYVYVLKSLRNGKQYIGFSSRDPLLRLQEHNGGKNEFTRNNGPFKLVYVEKYEDEVFARKREKYFKSGHGRCFLKKVIPP